MRLYERSIETLGELLYEARESAFARLQEDAQRYDADEVIGVKTRVYNLGGGLVEFMVIGTAVKKLPDVKTASNTLLPQAIVADQNTFIEADPTGGTDTRLTNSTEKSARDVQRGPISIIITIIVIVFYVIASIFGRH